MMSVILSASSLTQWLDRVAPLGPPRTVLLAVVGCTLVAVGGTILVAMWRSRPDPLERAWRVVARQRRLDRGSRRLLRALAGDPSGPPPVTLLLSEHAFHRALAKAGLGEQAPPGLSQAWMEPKAIRALCDRLGYAFPTDQGPSAPPIPTPVSAAQVEPGD